MIHRYLDLGYHCFVTTIHVDLCRRFCISAVSEQGSVHEYVVKLLAMFGCVVRGFVVVLLFVERVGQKQLVFDCPVPEPLTSACLVSECVSSDEFGVDCFCFVVLSDLCVEVSSNQYVRVRTPALVIVFLELGVHLLHVFVTVSRVREVD